MTPPPKLDSQALIDGLAGRTIKQARLDRDKIRLTFTDSLTCVLRATSSDHGEPTMEFELEQETTATVTTPKKAPKGKRRPIVVDDEPEETQEAAPEEARPTEAALIASEVLLVYVLSDGTAHRALFPKNTAPTWLLEIEGKWLGTITPTHAETLGQDTTYCATPLQAQLLERVNAAMLDYLPADDQEDYPREWAKKWLQYLVKEQRPVVLAEGGIVITAGCSL